MKNGLKAITYAVLTNQEGITIPLVAIMMLVLLGFAALAIDVSHLYVVRNELQNAADAGALAGARFLYTEDGAAINYEGFTDSAGNTYQSANQIAYDAARDNRALAETGAAIAVDVNWSEGQNEGIDVDVQRGHWSFATHSFEAKDYPFAVDLDRPAGELDSDPNFINAVRVVARRQRPSDGMIGTPAASFFARIFGYDDFELSMDAVAYIGFAGSLRPQDVDQPIAICRQSITGPDGALDCATGRMINSGSGADTNTAAWTNFSQPCQTATPDNVEPLVCADGNPDSLDFGTGMGTVGGMQTPIFEQMRECWRNAPDLAPDDRGYPTLPWTLTLPVIDCPDNNPGPCSTLVGAVTLDVLFIKQSGTDPEWQDIPLQMEGWTCSHATGDNPLTIDTMTKAQRQECWQEFSEAFDLNTADDTPVEELKASSIQKTMFFRPDCQYHEPQGTTRGINFGVLARIPVLVE